MKALKRIFFLISFFLWVISAAFTFGDSRSQYNVPLAAYSVCTADIDLDGDIDIVVGHNLVKNWSGISYLKNINSGYFVLTDSLYFFGWQYVHSGQLDSNPYPEIIFKKENASTEFIGIIFNNNFADSVFLDTYSYSGIEYIGIGDIDNNGYNDIIFASNHGQFFGVFYNYGNAIFSLPEFHSLTGTYPTGLACYDLNNDGREDIVVFGAKVEIFYSFATGFQDVLLCEHQTNGWISDFNQDGKKDIICFDDLSMVGLTGVTVFENTGSGTFTKHDEIVFPFPSSNFYVSDFNNDGLPDLLFQLSNKSGNVIYYNMGGNQLGDSTFVAVENYGEPWRNCCCADMDGNGFNDIVTVRTSYIKLPYNIDIKFNDGYGHFIDQPSGVWDRNGNNRIGLVNIFPNPFTNRTCIEFLLSETDNINLAIYDINGKIITFLLNDKMPAGNHKVIWNRVDKYGNSCKSGIYFAVLKTNSNEWSIQKIVIYK